MKTSLVISLGAIFFVSLLISPIMGVQQNMQTISSKGTINWVGAIPIFEADFETGTFEGEDVETFTWPVGPPDQVVEISDTFAHSGIYSAKCAGATTPDGMKARVCAGKCQGVDVLPVVGSIMEGHIGAWFYIKEWDGSSLGLLDFRAHVPPEQTDVWITFLTFEPPGNKVRLRYDWPNFGEQYEVSFDCLALIGGWHFIQVGFSIDTNGWYKVWIDGELVISIMGIDNTKATSGPHEGKDTPPADRAFAGITARGSDGGYHEIYIDDFVVTD